jgi:hypothetical protein
MSLDDNIPPEQLTIRLLKELKEEVKTFQKSGAMILGRIAELETKIDILNSRTRDRPNESDTARRNRERTWS